MTIKSFGSDKPTAKAMSKQYHGSNSKVTNPEIRIHRFTKDFGPGFYITNNKRQAEEFVVKFGNRGKVNVYNYIPEHLKELNVKVFEDMNDEWLDFIAECRRGIEHTYDMVEGPMADDQIWDHVADFLNGKMTREIFWKYAAFSRPTHQICLLTDKSLKCIEFIESYEVISNG